jgi:hypothetical protein
MHRTLDQEVAVARREKAATQREKVAIEWELTMEERSKAAHDMVNHAKATLKLIEEQHADLQKRELAVAQEKASLAAIRADLAKHAQSVKERGTTHQKREMVLQERKAKVEELLTERSAGIDRVVRWVGEANPSLDALGLSPIQVAEAPPSLGAILLVLDYAAERLRHMESAVLDRLETEGRVVARATTEYILTCYRSHNPAIPLTPILVGPV